MKICCCCITSANFLPQTLVATNSVSNHIPDIDVAILVADEVDLSKHKTKLATRRWLNLEDLNCANVMASYQGNSLRWAIKPYLIRNLLNEYDGVIYMDNDLYCIERPQELLEKMNSSGLVITPHRRSMATDAETPLKFGGIGLIMSDGYFNAGLLAATHKGIPAIDWWMEACAWNCPSSPTNGLFSDQKYLDIIALHYRQIVHILEHEGYNVASWNIWNNPLISKEGKLLVNEKWPLVFAHLTSARLRDDQSLNPLYEIYNSEVQKMTKELRINDLLLSYACKEWGIFCPDHDGPLNNRLWTKPVAEKMLNLFRKGRIRGFRPRYDYELKHITEVISTNPS